ncbi:hypothetical protein ACFQFQ_14565 [Sulfitobacter porphyrae]|uniref:Uncharacterized protein n=1 Tax=Sulfitobacter porphyrae TaxID=1246864 RepID=A0ABW2B5J1_9RHOB|nr:hypothetical protein GCM10007928_02140 [Sulfitobacter porphyrae]
MALWKKKIGGEIRRHGLEDWWLSVLTENEREAANQLYTPMGAPRGTLTEGSAERQPELDTVCFVANLAVWLSKPGHMDLALKVADHARNNWGEPDPSPKAWQRHFAASHLCKVYYRWRDEVPSALPNAIWACERGIEVSSMLAPVIEGDIVVGHHCFRQLAIIREKQGDFNAAISVCHLAKQRGWNDDWDKRIAKLEKKAARSA